MERSRIKTIFNIQQLAERNYNCSQILMLLNLKQTDQENVILIRSMSGLANGCGFFHETCGVMTGAACVMAYYAGKGSDNEAESDKLMPMLEDLGIWFRQVVEKNYDSTLCKDIIGDKIGTPAGKKICGRLILLTHTKINEIIDKYEIRTEK